MLWAVIKLENMDLFETLAESFKPPHVVWEEKEERDAAHKYASDLFYYDLAELYCGDLIVLPLTKDGEVERERLYKEDDIGRYGAYEKNFEFNGVVYLAILVNND